MNLINAHDLINDFCEKKKLIVLSCLQGKRLTGIAGLGIS